MSCVERLTVMSAIYRTGARVAVMCSCSLAASFVLAVHLNSCGGETVEGSET